MRQKNKTLIADFRLQISDCRFVNPFTKISILIAIILIVALLLIGCSRDKEKKKPNVLFICVDDLRPELGVYGNELIQSPNLDRLASEGALFNRHYVNMPTSGASRFSLLTGMLPTSTADLQNSAIEKNISGKAEGDNPESFIHHLKRNGYYTVGIGKISHSADGRLYGYNDPVGNSYELPNSWDERLFNAGKWETGWNAFFAYSDGSNRQSKKKQVKPYEFADVEDEGYPDGLSANLGIQKLKELSIKNKPFFLGVGFFKPHLPFNAPKKYWDMYDEEKISTSQSGFIPENINTASLHGSGEFNQYQLGDEKVSLDKAVSNEYARKLRHAYYACISYIDAQIGKLLDELEKLDLADNTIVVVWGDHGWHLGDHLVWGKHTLFEAALRSALIVKAPDMKQRGKARNQVVSTTDIYPTILDLCKIKQTVITNGKSFSKLLKAKKNADWKNIAYSYFRKGISVRTDKYRLTKYFRKAEPTIELYNHNNDPFENINIAENYPEIVDSLMPIIEKGNTGLYSNNK